jgi:hypothetical protein
MEMNPRRLTSLSPFCTIRRPSGIGPYCHGRVAGRNNRPPTVGTDRTCRRSVHGHLPTFALGEDNGILAKARSCPAAVDPNRRAGLPISLEQAAALVLSYCWQDYGQSRSCKIAPLAKRMLSRRPSSPEMEDWRVPLSPPHVRGEVVVLEGGVEKLRMPMEAERLTKAMMAGHAQGEMPAKMRLMPLEPLVQSMAAAEREFTTGEGWRRS